MQKKFLLLLSMFIVLLSCKKTEVVIYSDSSQLWIKVSDKSVSFIKNLEVEFPASDVENNSKDFFATYSAGSFKPNLGTMDNKWTKVYEAFSRADSISVVFNGKTYKTRGFGFGEKRLIEITLTYPSVDGEFKVVDHDITEVNKTIYIQ